MKNAIISVWDKTGIVELADFLISKGVRIYSTGGTKKTLEENGIEVHSVSNLTGFGSMMDGRVKTLHPYVFGGILADRNNSSHINDLSDLNAPQFDLVIVNFYPFKSMAVEKELSLEESINFIDIGGPSMLRAAAKNYRSVIPLANPDIYKTFIKKFLDNNGVFSDDDRKEFASIVFKLTADYDKMVYNYFCHNEVLSLDLHKESELRYGENPHQDSSFYRARDIKWNMHQGKQLSYNNYFDLESAIRIVLDFTEPSCSIIKHSNPCGFGSGDSLLSAYRYAVESDPISYFGGIVGFNGEIDEELAKELVQPFLECIIAISVTENALKIFKKKKNLRIITVDRDFNLDKKSIRTVMGGYLVQDVDKYDDEIRNSKVVTKNTPSKNDYEAIELAWKLVRYVKSNAILISNSNMILGVGAGQMSRVDSVKIAISKINKSNLNLGSVVLASDAFFPFPDSLEIASEAGIKIIVQPGGSIKDDEIIEVADRLGMIMIFTGVRHFYH